MVSPEAAFDILTIHADLDETPYGVSHGEGHLLCYLACLLALYRGIPAADWTYTFVRTGWGTPFSEHVAAAYAALLRSGNIMEIGAVYRLSSQGRVLQEQLRSQQQFGWRMPFLEAASSTALALPVGLIREALHGEPNLRAASAFDRTAALLQEYTLHELYDQFAALSEAIGIEVSDLLVPSTVWLSYLLEVERRRPNLEPTQPLTRSLAAAHA